MIPEHLYNKDPQSGAGNCTCGSAHFHYVHYHEFVQSAVEYGGRLGICVCGLREETEQHRWGIPLVK